MYELSDETGECKGKNNFPRKPDRGISRTKTVLESPRHSRGLFAVRVSPQKSVNNPAADFRRLV